MSPSQNKRYWREWSKIRKMLVEMGDFSKEDADAQRHQIHIRALGKNTSSKDLTNRDLDAIFSHFQTYLVLIDGPSKAPDQDGECKRLIWAITQLGLDEPYLASISQDQFGTPEWRKLPEADLRNFRFTATSRAAAKRRAARAANQANALPESD